MIYKLCAAFFVGLLLTVLAFAQDDSRIAFITLDGEVATVDASGDNLRVLSEEGQRFQFPVWSPDGEKLAVIGADAESGFIFVLQDSEAGNKAELYRSRSQSPFYAYWSPDSQRLSFLANHPVGGIALHIASEAIPDQILALGSPFYWQWAGDSQSLLMHSGFNRPTARLGFSSRVRDTLTENLAAPGRFQAPGISVSGQYIAYAVEDVQGRRVVLRNNPGLNDMVIEREVPHLGIAAMTWNPVKDQLAIMSPIQNNNFYYGPISLLDAETGLLEQLSTQVAVAFFWSPDGRYLAYFSPAQGGATAQSGSTHQRVSSDLGQVQLGGLLSLNIIDTETMQEEELAVFLPSLQFTRQFLPFFDQYALSHSIWSPGSDAIVLPVAGDARLDITVFGLDGSVERVAEGDTPFFNRK